MSETIQRRVLDAAQRLCRERGSWTFEVAEIVRALPDLNSQSVRTHVTSRCCVNAPANHAHRWPYFRRLTRGHYEIMPAWRKAESPRPAQVREAQPVYAAAPPAKSLLHAHVSQSGGWYVAELAELAVVTQGRTLDEIAANVRDALRLHLQGEDRASLGLDPRLRVAITYEADIDA